MIGLQNLIIKKNIKVIQLAKELGIKPERIWDWIKNNRIPEKHLNMLAEKFNVKKEYLNKKVNDISTYKPKQTGFCNKYIVEGNITKIILNRRKGKDLVTVIDTEDLQKLIEYNHTWYASYHDKVKGYYAHTTISLGKINGKNKYGAISLQVFLANPEQDKKIRVDHQNYKTLDNRKKNLRTSLHEENSKHRNGKNKNNKSGYRNVILDKKSGKYIIMLCINYKRFRVGKYYEDVDEAGRDAEMYRKQYYGEFAGRN